jgi:hypothetical protein
MADFEMNARAMKVIAGLVAAVVFGGGAGSLADLTGARNWQQENKDLIAQAKRDLDHTQDLEAQVAKMTQLILNGCHTRQEGDPDGR